MAIISKTDNTTVLSLQSVAANTVVISSVVDVSTKFAGTVFLHFGRRNAASGTVGVNLRVEASSKSSGNGHWYPLATVTTDFTACESEALTGTINAGATTLTLASTTNLTAGDTIYIDNGTIANSEWARIKSIVAATSVTIEDALTNAQTGATIYDRAEMYPITLDLTSVKRLRLVVDGAQFTQAFAIESHIVTGDSIS